MRPRPEVARKLWKVADLSGRASTSSVISCPTHRTQRAARVGQVCSCVSRDEGIVCVLQSTTGGRRISGLVVHYTPVNTLLKPSYTDNPKISHPERGNQLRGNVCYPPVTRGQRFRCGACAFLTSGRVLRSRRLPAQLSFRREGHGQNGAPGSGLSAHQGESASPLLHGAQSPCMPPFFLCLFFFHVYCNGNTRVSIHLFAWLFRLPFHPCCAPRLPPGSTLSHYRIR